jgi:hypothetical protein
MFKKVIFFSLIILAGCSTPPPVSKETTKTTSKPKTIKTPRAAVHWTVNTFPPKEGEVTRKKYVKLVTEGSYTDSTLSKKYLYTEVIVNKNNAGIFLRKLKKSNPAEKFNDPVHITMTDSSGSQLNMISSRPWNKSGGIMIEGNNNDYSQFRIFLLQHTGNIMVEVSDSRKNNFQFSMNIDDFGENFSKL